MPNPLTKRLVLFLQKRLFTSKPLTQSPPKTNTDLVTPHQLSTSFAVQYLINSCGLPLKSAISASKNVLLVEKNKHQYDSVVCLLKSHHFTDTQVAKFLGKYPAILCSSMANNTEPKLRLLTENGVSGVGLAKVLVVNPYIFSRSLDAQLRPSMELIKRFVACKEKLAVVIDRCSWMLTSDLKGTLRPNVDFLIKQGVPEDRIAELLVLQPRCMVQDVERMVNAVGVVRGFGVEPDSVRFIQNLRVLLSLSDRSWKRKVGVFESMGWSYGDVISTFVRSPHCFSLSEEKIRAAMDYLVNTVRTDPKTIVGYPKVLMYSVEKRMVPRYTIWMILQERKLLPRLKFLWMLNKSEKSFIEQYVTRFQDEIPHLLSIYHKSKKIGKVSI